MTKLEWDKAGERFYDSGLDHGVLYVPNDQGLYDNGFSWNGLLSIEEDFGDDSTDPYYYDGIKYLDAYNNGDFSATMTAYTYPDEFLEFEGMHSLYNGLYVDDQASKVFGLSYRTFSGNDTQGLSLGYKIHLVYNLTAIPKDPNYQNGSNSLQPMDFQWDLTSVPEKAHPYRPTGHIILDSEDLNADILQTIEDIIYGKDVTEIAIDGRFPLYSGKGRLDGGTPGSPGSGTEDGNEEVFGDAVNPRLPSLQELIMLVLNWDPKLIMPNSITGLSSLITGTGDLTLIKVPGIYTALPTTRLAKTDISGLYTLNI